MSQHCLVIVPCGRSKVWDAEPDHGPALARDAYTGTPFRLNRAFAERYGDAWVVLSAKYGFIPPNFVIPAPYEVTFKRLESGPVSIDLLREQVSGLGLHRFREVIGLGGKEYRAAITAAFAPLRITPIYPFAGLPSGKAMQATRQAIDAGLPFPEVTRTGNA